jgi:hypothetical protein
MNIRTASTRSEALLKSPHSSVLIAEFFRSLPVVPVVIDPVLARRLRPHQVEGSLALLSGVGVNSHTASGVKFMYDCVMGLRKHEGQGCILADEMYVFLLSWRPVHSDGVCGSKGDWEKPFRLALQF